MVIFVLYALRARSEPGATGGHISNFELVRDIAKRQRVCLIAPNVSSHLNNELREIGVNVVTRDFKENGFRARIRRRSWIAQEVRRQLAESDQPTKVAFSSNGTCDLVDGAIRGAKSDCRHVIVTRAFEDMHLTTLVGSARTLLKGALFEALSGRRVRKAYRSADFVITNSGFMRRSVSRYFRIPAEGVLVLYPPLDLPKAFFRRPTTLPQIGIVNPSKRKGEDLFRALARRHPELNFSYFGPRDNGYSEPNVSYRGWRSKAEDIYNEIDILLVPSRWQEPFGRVAAEATASGIPVLVSNRGGLPETVDYPFVVPNDDTEQWSAALRRVLTNPSQTERAWSRSVEICRRFARDEHETQVKLLMDTLSV